MVRRADVPQRIEMEMKKGNTMPLIGTSTISMGHGFHGEL
jgi:hypothetical protein